MATDSILYFPSLSPPSLSLSHISLSFLTTHTHTNARARAWKTCFLVIGQRNQSTSNSQINLRGSGFTNSFVFLRISFIKADTASFTLLCLFGARRVGGLSKCERQKKGVRSGSIVLIISAFQTSMSCISLPISNIRSRIFYLAYDFTHVSCSLSVYFFILPF